MLRACHCDAAPALTVRCRLAAGWDWEVLPDAQETMEDEYDNIYDYNFLPRRVKVAVQAGGKKFGQKQFFHSGKNKTGWANIKRSTYGKEPWKAEGPYTPRK